MKKSLIVLVTLTTLQPTLNAFSLSDAVNAVKNAVTGSSSQTQAAAEVKSDATVINQLNAVINQYQSILNQEQAVLVQEQADITRCSVEKSFYASLLIYAPLIKNPGLFKELIINSMTTMFARSPNNPDDQQQALRTAFSLAQYLRLAQTLVSAVNAPALTSAETQALTNAYNSWQPPLVYY